MSNSVKSKSHPDKSSGNKPPVVEIDAEDGDPIEPPPPELVEPDPEMTPEEAEQARKDYLLTRFWISARGYWGSNGDRLAWAFSIGLLILIVVNVGFQYGINVWNRAIFDAIEKRDSATVFWLTAVFFPLAIGSVLIAVAQVFARMGIQRRWRAWLTSSVLTRWLAHGRYYQLNLVSGEDRNQAEAEFRYALTRVRENGESIALLGGEDEERDGIDRNFTKVLRQWARLAGQHMRTTLVSQGSSLIAPVVPLLLCAPKFLD